MRKKHAPLRNGPDSFPLRRVRAARQCNPENSSRGKGSRLPETSAPLHRSGVWSCRQSLQATPSLSLGRLVAHSFPMPKGVRPDYSFLAKLVCLLRGEETSKPTLYQGYGIGYNPLLPPVELSPLDHSGRFESHGQKRIGDRSVDRKPKKREEERQAAPVTGFSPRRTGPRWFSD